MSLLYDTASLVFNGSKRLRVLHIDYASVLHFAGIKAGCIQCLFDSVYCISNQLSFKIYVKIL